MREGDEEKQPSYKELIAAMPTALRMIEGESAKQYRERIAPAFSEFLVAKAVVLGDAKSLELSATVMMKDMDTKIRMAQIIGPNGIKKQMIEAGADDFREMTGMGNIPSAAAGIAAGVIRPSDLASQ